MRLIERHPAVREARMKVEEKQRELREMENAHAELIHAGAAVNDRALKAEAAVIVGDLSEEEAHAEAEAAVAEAKAAEERILDSERRLQVHRMAIETLEQRVGRIRNEVRSEIEAAIRTDHAEVKARFDRALREALDALEELEPIRREIQINQIMGVPGVGGSLVFKYPEGGSKPVKQYLAELA